MSINVCNDRSMASITSLPSGVSGSSLVFISEQTASSSSTISFTSGIDSTYKEYIFKFSNIHPGTDDKTLQFNMSADSGSNYNVTKTSSFFRVFNNESDSGFLTYRTAEDLAQSTAFQSLTTGSATMDDSSINGELHLFDPSSTTFVKHFISTVIDYANGSSAMTCFVAGYGNTTSAVDAIQFKMSSGNIDAGTIKLYGVS
jgi:hypothetical protein